MTVLEKQHVRDRHLLLVENRQDRAGQRGGPGQTQLFQAVFGSCQVVAIENFDLIAGQQRRQLATQGTEYGGNLLSRVMN